MVATVLQGGGYDEVRFEDVRALVEKYEGTGRARERANEFTAKARSLLAMLPDSPARGAMMAATELVAERDR